MFIYDEGIYDDFFDEFALILQQALGKNLYLGGRKNL